MDNTISIEQIQNTKSYLSLNAVQQSFCIKRKNRELLTNGLIVHRNTGVIPVNLQGYNLSLLEDLILGEPMKSE